MITPVGRAHKCILQNHLMALVGQIDQPVRNYPWWADPPLGWRNANPVVGDDPKCGLKVSEGSLGCPGGGLMGLWREELI